MKPIVVELNQQKNYVYAERVQGQIWMHYNGRTVCISESKNTRLGSSGVAADADGSVYSPMPGKILKVNVQQGDSVSLGQVLIVMEAMKMEYSLTANIAGKVAVLNCKPGDQVQKETLLVKVQE